MGNGKIFLKKGDDILDSAKHHSASVHPINIKGGGKDGK